MANFNYLDFFKTPSGNDTKLFIKDINNKVQCGLFRLLKLNLHYTKQ
jgi:hypothetical protein